MTNWTLKVKAWRFFTCYIQSDPKGGLLCSPEHGKLCSEHRETLSDAQNNLPCRGPKNTFQSQGFVWIKNGSPMKGNSKKQFKRTGRPPKTDPAKIRYTISLNEEEHARFLALFDRSGMRVKAHFITSCIFDKTIKTVHIDKGTVDFYMRLTSFHGQFRSVGVNYNQIVKLLYRNFSEKKASAYLYKLEKQTAVMTELFKNIVALTGEFDEKYLKNRQ